MNILDNTKRDSSSDLILELSDNKVRIVDNSENDEYLKKNVCLPYFKEIYRDLAERSSNINKGINKVTFFDYIELPGILAERLFAVFDENGDTFIDLNEFVVGMFKIYVSSLEIKLRLVFDIYDFNKHGHVSKDDIKTVLCYIPVNKILDGKEIRKEGKFTQEGGGNEVYLDRIQSMEEIESLLQDCFGTQEKITFEDFVKINQEHSSDMLLTILSFLREKLPCSENFWRYEKGLKNLENKVPGSPGKSSPLASPKHLSKFSPLSPIISRTSTKNTNRASSPGPNALHRYALANQTFDKSNANSSEDDSNSTNSTSFKEDNHKTQSSNALSKFKATPPPPRAESHKKHHITQECASPMMSPSSFSGVRLANFASVSAKNPSSFADFVKNTEEEVHSPSTFLEGQVERITVSSSQENKEVVKFEGELLKKTGPKVAKNYWFSLENKELYYYKKREDTKHKGMHSLVGVFVKEELEEIVDKKTVLYPFRLIFPHKSRIYYALNREDKDNWMNAIKKAIGYANLYDFYEVKEKLGKGKFGLVKAAIHKKTGKRVAVKIIKKKEMTIQDLELLKREIEILKICQHPNIIRLLDIFENPDYIYIIMELLKGGDLFSYLERRNFKVSEERAREMAHSLATSVFYLHSYGITHRDLKPENILMVDDSETSDIKLVDFGLSKIIGPNETCNEPFGTLSYVAPEVLQQKPYGKAVDLWSIGVITYLLLSGTLPFDDEDDREVARQTIYDPADFNFSIWLKVSNEAKHFVKGLLVKDPKKRMTLEQVLEHPWLIKGTTGIEEMRRASLNDRVSKFAVYSHSHPNSPKIQEEVERRSNENDVGGY